MEPFDPKTELQIGKFYNVRCAKMVNHCNDNDYYFLPVIGEPHVDKAFYNHKHIHIDGRFVNQKQMNTLNIDEHGRTNVICNYPSELINDTYLVSEIVVHRMKCKRLSTGIYPPKHVMKPGNKFYDWSQTMIGKECKGKKCPHLGTTMHEEDGVLVCPLHNLMTDKFKEKIVGVKLY